MEDPLADLQRLSFTIILHAGNARSLAMEALLAAKKFDFTAAREKIKKAEKEFTLAHKEHTDLLQKAVHGTTGDIPIILVHAQDHLMMALTVRDLANEMIHIYEKIQRLEDRQ